MVATQLEIVDGIRQVHRERCFAMEQRKRADLALLSFLRTQLGWRKDLPDDESKAIKELAMDLVATGEAIERAEARLDKKHTKAIVKAIGKGAPEPGRERRERIEGEDNPEFVRWRELIRASIRARAPFDKVEADASKIAGELAAQLPVWREFEGVRGFGLGGLSIIVGEAGDLGNYATHSKLWKRMGLAFMDEDGVRQGGLLKSASKDDWIRHGYNRQRRSRMWNIGDALIKNNAEGRYRTVYLARKDYERAKAEAAGLIVAPAAKIPKKRKNEFRSDGHIHRRAQRYMEKCLLRDIWKAWRRATCRVPERAIVEQPAASEHRDAA